VTLAELNDTLYFSNSSYFTFNNLSPGTYYVRVEKAGYPSVIKTATVPVDGTVNLGTIDITTLVPLPAGTGAEQVSWNWNSGPYYHAPDITNSFSLNLTVPTTFNISYEISNNDLTAMSVVPVGTDTVETYNGWDALIYNYGSTTPIWQLQVGYQQSKAGSTSFVLPAGNYSFSLGPVQLSNSTITWNAYYLVDDEAPAISLSETWCNSSPPVSVSIDCTDTVSGVKSVQYAISSSPTTPGQYTAIPAHTAVQFTSPGTWFLFVTGTDAMNNSYTRVEGPFIINGD
jgi:hypothetical protein